jgi:tetratricopeptide (TPR) repeat protein
MREARYAEAKGQFTTVTQLAPLNARGWSNLGAALSNLDREKEAIAAFERSAKLRPYARVEDNLGGLLFYEGRLDEAASHLRRAIAIDPGFYHAHGNLADVLRHTPGGADSARIHYERAIQGAESELEVNPHDFGVLAALAWYNAGLGRAPDARRRMTQALAESNDDPEIQFYAVKVYEELGERATALAYLRHALDAGYSLVEVRRNPDLVDLRKDPRTRRLLENRG